MFTADKNTRPNKKIIAEAIAYNEDVRTKRYDPLDNYYKGLHPILGRTRSGDQCNNKLVTNHAKYISDLNVSYLLGTPVEYQAKDSKSKSIDLKPITTAFDQQNIANVDIQVAKAVSKFGTAYDYTYTDEEKNIYTKVLDPRNCIIVYDSTVEHEKLFAIIYSGCDVSNSTDKKYMGVVVVDEKEIVEYTEKLEPSVRTPHGFQEVPVVQYWNNDEGMGDYEPVTTLMDAYNILQSDRLNDKEQLVDAILMLYGVKLTDKQVERLKRDRVLASPTGTKAEFLIKQLDEENTDKLRQVFEQDIHKISMTPNMSDENFVGNSSGVAIEYKLLAFTLNIQNKERFFETGLMDRFQLYINYLTLASKLKKSFEVYEVDAVFKRSLPQNDLEKSQMIMNLDGKISNETAIAQLSFIDNADEEMDKLEKEQMENANTASPAFGTDHPTPDNTVSQDNNVVEEA